MSDDGDVFSPFLATALDISRGSTFLGGAINNLCPRQTRVLGYPNVPCWGDGSSPS